MTNCSHARDSFVHFWKRDTFVDADATPCMSIETDAYTFCGIDSLQLNATLYVAAPGPNQSFVRGVVCATFHVHRR